MKRITLAALILACAWALACDGSNPPSDEGGVDAGRDIPADAVALDSVADAPPDTGRDPGPTGDPGGADATADDSSGGDPASSDPGAPDPGAPDLGAGDLDPADPGPADVPTDPGDPDLPADPGADDPGGDAATDVPASACEGGGAPKEWFLDCDGDGLAAPGTEALRACLAPAIPDVCAGGAWTQVPPDDEGTTDCDDQDPTSRPGLDEVCDYRDNDCDGRVDTAPVDGTAWYEDCDWDGVPPLYINMQSYRLCFIEPTRPPDACQEGTWTSRKPQLGQPKVVDCDDFDPAVNSLTSERCDGKDNDCDGSVDEDSTVLQWYADCDRDGYAAAEADSTAGCAFPSTRPAACPSSGSWTLVSPGTGTTDCLDGNAQAFPGQTKYFTTPIAGQTGTKAWDYDCDGAVAFSFTGDCTNGEDYTCTLDLGAWPSCYTRAEGLRVEGHPEVCYLDVPPHQVCGKEMRKPPTCWNYGAVCGQSPFAGDPVFTAACR